MESTEFHCERSGRVTGVKKFRIIVEGGGPKLPPCLDAATR